MYPLDVDAQNACLDALLGDGAGASMPAVFEVALFSGDPANGGVELDSAGNYLRGTAANDSATFPDAVDGETRTLGIAFADPTGEWTVAGNQEPATHWLLLDAADSTTAYFYGLLDEELNVYEDDAGVPQVVDISVSLACYWNVTSSEDS